MSKWKDIKFSFKQKTSGIQKPSSKKSVVRKDNSKIVALVAWSVITLIVTVSLLVLLLTVNTRSELNNLVSADSQEVTEEKEDKNHNIIGAKHFINNFVRDYINVQNNSEYLQQRYENLKGYMANGLEFENEDHGLYRISNLEGERELKSSDLYNILQDGEQNIFQYRVTYTNKVTVEREEEQESDDEDEKPEIVTVTDVEETDRTILLNVPFIAEGDLYAVSDVPYFSKVDSLKYGEELESVEDERELYEGGEVENLRAFLTDFFTRYANEEVEELTYIMAEPDSLNGAFNFSELSNIKIYSDDEVTFNIEIGVFFSEKETALPVYQKFNLTVVKQENRFFVEEMNHNN